MLIVDDSRVNRMVLSKIFQNEYRILEAENGQVAMELLRRDPHNIHVILLDIVMPVMDGMAVLELLSNDPVLCNIPVVVATAENSVALETKTLAMGAWEILHRPFSADIAKRRIKNILRASTPHTAEGQTVAVNERCRRNLILDQTNTFVIEYHYPTQQLHIDPNVGKYVLGDWSKIRIHPLAGLAGIVYRPDLSAVQAFLDLSDVKGNVYRSMNARLYAVSNMYEWFAITLSCYVDENGNKRYLMMTAHNVHREVEAVNKLEFLAESDQLTRIPNRDTFTAQTRAMLDSNPEQTYVMVRMDLERFRLINQLYGTEEGDHILKYTAVKLQECMESDAVGTYCRLASDVFAVCMPCDEARVKYLIDYLQECLKQYPIQFEITMSFGVYLIEDREISVETMLDRAFAAQKTVKGSYHNNVAYYDKEMYRREEAEQTTLLEMHDALEQGQFQIYLQPKCEMNSGKILGAEALVRWVHPERGLIPPSDFIPLFEKSGFITEMDYHIFDSTCALIRRWIDEDMPRVPISVNISRTDLYNPMLFQNIMTGVERHHIPHNAIEFELTESAFVADNLKFCNLIRDLQAQNFRVLMDDFGSGYSSLNSLKDLQVDVLKIDLKFIPASSTDRRAAAILSAVVEMANNLGLEVVAEGVETEEQAMFLRGIGCNMAQGYHYYHPMPVMQFEECLKNCVGKETMSEETNEL